MMTGVGRSPRSVSVAECRSPRYGGPSTATETLRSTNSEPTGTDTGYSKGENRKASIP